MTATRGERAPRRDATTDLDLSTLVGDMSLDFPRFVMLDAETGTVRP
jgi:hypothetical protein